MGFFSRKKSVELVSPLSGTILSLSDVPDPVFAEGTLGDGMAVVPDGGEAVAPCDGTISYIPDTKHAFALTADCGAEILVHLGLNTVGMNGEGFEALVQSGSHVAKGQVILRFDPDRLRDRGLNLFSPVVVSGGGTISKKLAEPGSHVVAGQDTLCSVSCSQ